MSDINKTFSLMAFMEAIQKRTFFYDDELLFLMKSFDLDYNTTYICMKEVGWGEIFTQSGERMHYRSL